MRKLRPRLNLNLCQHEESSGQVLQKRNSVWKLRLHLHDLIESRPNRARKISTCFSASASASRAPCTTSGGA
jgi:hypothetical protein